MLRSASQPPRDFVAAVVTAYQDTVDAATIQTKFLGQVEKVNLACKALLLLLFLLPKAVYLPARSVWMHAGRVFRRQVP